MNIVDFFCRQNQVELDLLIEIVYWSQTQTNLHQ